MLEPRKLVLREFPEDLKNNEKSGKLDKCGKIQRMFSQRKRRMKDEDYFSHSEGSATRERNSALWERAT